MRQIGPLTPQATWKRVVFRLLNKGVYLGGLGGILGILSGTELLCVLVNVTRASSSIGVGNKLVKIQFYVIYPFKIQAYYMIKMSISCLQIK